MALNRDLLGKVYNNVDPWTVEEAGTRAYALATNAAVPGYTAQPPTMAPPMYGVVYQYMAMAAPLFDPELGVNMMRLVHGEHDMTFLAPVFPGDVIRSTTTIQSITDKTSGELLELSLHSANAKGQPVLQSVAGLFIRGRTRRGPAGAAPEAPEASSSAPSRGDVIMGRDVQVTADQSLRYADASGDHNPIHKDEEMARAAGLPGIILQGLCSMAFIHNAVVETLAAGAPMGVRRIRVRFAKPVLNGQTLRVRAHRTAEPAQVSVDVLAGDVAVVEDARVWLA
jgi:acyl dehydratase